MAPAKKLTVSPKRNHDAPSFYVGIGASAGGLRAFEELLKHLSPATGMTFIFVSHLSTKHKSLLSEILKRMTKLTVSEVVHGTKALSNQLYVLPPNKSLTIENGILKLKKRDASERPHLPINRFFESLALDQGNRAISVVLSGTGEDGARGSLAIKSCGGVSFAQTPDSAQFVSMPESTITIDHVDFILKPKEIALRLHKISKMADLVLKDDASDTKSKDFVKIVQLLKQVSGTDFGQYKPTTIRRRIERRMLLQKMESLSDYLKFLTQNETERYELMNDVLINVTYFFREPESLDHLKKVIIPSVIKNKDAELPLRIWIAGCSTGEEAYSVAIIVSEIMKGNANQDTVQIFATDLSEKCIDKARLGKFSSIIEETVSRERLSKFFNKIETGYRISKSVRDLCIFAKHDLGRNPSYSKMDIISCKNLLIYLGQDLQTKVIENFHYSLNKHGYLCLGTSETVGQSSHLFTMVEPKFKIYGPKGISKMNSKSHMGPDLVAIERVPFKVLPPKNRTTTTFDLNMEADRAIISRYSPPSVVINAKLEILLFRGRTEAFLSHKHGEATLNLLRLTKENLSAHIKKAFEKVKNKDHSVREEFILMPDGSKISFEIIPLKFLAGERCYLVVFENDTEGKSKKSPKTKSFTQSTAMNELREELSSVKDNLQAMIQDFENANQDLQSANEEIVSSNEELQSTNEELETSKEELQSTNEELSTVNQELHERNIELLTLNNDLLNVLNSVQIPILIVGNDHKIRRYTPSASKVFNLIPTDLGRPLSHITSSVIDTNVLGPMVSEVIGSAVIQEKEIKTKKGLGLIIRVRPYKTEEQKIEGVVISFHEVFESGSLVTFMETVLQMVKSPLAVVDENLTLIFANTALKKVFRDPQEIFSKKDLIKKFQSSPKMIDLQSSFEWKNYTFTFKKINDLKESNSRYLVSIQPLQASKA